jgi:acetyltransferase-like isoleucine patch superfamily enzyme
LIGEMAEAADTTQPLVVRRALSLARDHARAGRADEAEFLYRQVLGADPGNVDALAGLGGAQLVAAPAPVSHGSFAWRVYRRLGRPIAHELSRRPRIWKYRALSTNAPLIRAGRPIIHQPVLFLGSGTIVLGDRVQFGWPASPLFYTGYCHVEAAGTAGSIEFGDRVEFNNNAMLKSEGAGIRIGCDGLFGANVEIFDTDFHDLDPEHRHGGSPRMAPVEIGDNVFVGMSVKIMKGVTIGADSVIGAGAVVSSSIPAGVIATGNPARVIRAL